MTEASTRLERLLGGPELAWLRTRVRARLERGGSLTGTVTLTEPTGPQRAAIARLLGKPVTSGRTVSVRLADVDEVLRRSGVCEEGLACAIETLTGPVERRAAADAARERAWQEAFAPLEEAVSGNEELTAWCEGVRQSGLVRRLLSEPHRAGPVLADLARVVSSLPSDGEHLGTFAARTVGSSHALDPGRPLATLAFGAARVLGDTPDGSGAAWQRAVWGAVGLLKDAVSSTVLVLGFPGDDGSPTGRALAAGASAGEPAVLTLRQLVNHPPWLSSEPVLICENPAIVSAAADRLGTGTRPLVCTNGQPSAATLHLLRLLHEAGAPLAYHGDFDWAGIQIANRLFTTLPIRSWRFDATDYNAAPSYGHPLTGRRIEAVWDPALAETMTTTGKAVEEEIVVDDLVGDLHR